MTQRRPDLLDVMASRRSIRAFLPTPVAPSLVRQILTVAGTAPSGSNMQPWRVHVVAGEARDRLSAALSRAHADGEPEQREYVYYPPQWRSPYIERRRATGWGLYQTLGIDKADRAGMHRQHGRNYQFFDAPLVMLFTIDRDLGMGSWLDYGTFLQSIMVAARACGLDTCPQASLANYPAIVREQLGVPDDQIVLCGLSMGYAAPDAPVNGYQPERLPLEAFVTFHGDADEPLR